MRNTRRIPALLPVLTLVVLICGCGTSEPDGRYEQLVEKTLEQQAAQNQAMAKQSQEVAEATRQLVEGDAKARQEMAATHRDLQTGLQSERKNIDRQHDELEQERREIASQRHRDPIIAGAIIQAAGFLAAVVPLALVFVLLRSLQHEDPDAVVGESRDARDPPAADAARVDFDDDGVLRRPERRGGCGGLVGGFR